MATKKKRTSVRNIGQEILDGINDIKAGRIGRVVTRPSVGSVREKTGLSQSPARPKRTRIKSRNPLVLDLEEPNESQDFRTR